VGEEIVKPNPAEGLFVVMGNDDDDDGFKTSLSMRVVVQEQYCTVQ
jgi:hypothetical protein